VPHIKVKSFDTKSLDRLIDTDEQYEFRAISERGDYELLGVLYEGERFLLEIKKSSDEYLIKPDLLSRPLDVNKIKKMLSLLAADADLEILHSNIALSPSKPKLSEDANKMIRDFEEPIFTKDKVAIEVGFGSGRHLMYQAAKNPDTLYIGIEIHTPSAQQVLKQIKLQNLDNIWIVNYDARLLLEMMPSNSCSDIYVHFPVPWDKKPHRRVISDRFLAESLRVLEVDAELELRTDSDNYYRYALETFSASPKVSFRVDKNLDLAVISKYEDRWRAQDKDIYTLRVVSRLSSEEPSREYDFSFGNIDDGVGQIEKLPSQAIVDDEYFVHFERKYNIVGESSSMVKCAFGSFDKPEHKYIEQRGAVVSYYPNNPVKTEINHQAHQKIGDLIYG